MTREFCAECGTHMITIVPGMPAAIIKVGTLDEPAAVSPQAAIFTLDKQPFHTIPQGMPAFERMPGR